MQALLAGITWTFVKQVVRAVMPAASTVVGISSLIANVRRRVQAVDGRKWTCQGVPRFKLDFMAIR
jgi:hypothetical protein